MAASSFLPSGLSVVAQTSGFPGVPVVNQARLVAPDGTGQLIDSEGYVLLAADVSTLTVTVTDLGTGTVVLAATSLTPSAVMSTPVADDVWKNVSEDTVGRTFRHTVSGTHFLTANRTYRVLYTLTTTGGSVLYFAFDRRTIPLA